MYKDHVPMIRDYALSGPDRTFDVGLFVLCTMNKHLELVPRMVDSFHRYGLDSNFFSKNQRYAVASLWDGREYLHSRAHAWVDSWAYPEDVVREIVELPGLGIVKGAFFAQLLGFEIGCLDRHNLRLAGLKEKTFTRVPPSTEGLRKRLQMYVALCGSLGGSQYLWDSWCVHVAKLRPRVFVDAEAVSQLHVDCIIKG